MMGNTFIWILGVLGVVDALAMALWYACSWPRSQILGPALVRGSRTNKQLALTFDDGPCRPYTEQILDILQERGVPATFFVCGKDVEQHPEIVRRIYADGHTLGNHTWSHRYFYFLSRTQIAAEIDRTQDAIAEATGETPRIFRPPYGARWFGLYPILRERDMALIQWSVDARDWALDAKSIVESVCAALHPGAIVLLHDSRQAPGGYLQNRLRKQPVLAAPDLETGKALQTAEALPAIIDRARAAGFEFVSVEDLRSS